MGQSIFILIGLNVKREIYYSHSNVTLISTMFLKCWVVSFFIITVYGKTPTRPKSLTMSSAGAGKFEKIVGGKSAKIHRFPFSVALFQFYVVDRDWDFICGGSILTATTVLTAGHCLYKDRDPKHYYIRYGHEDYDKAPFHTYVADFLIHKIYRETKNSSHDIALLYLQSKIKWDDSETLPWVKIYRHFPYPLKKAYASGWGSITRFPAEPEYETKLKYTIIKVHHPENCKKYFTLYLNKPWHPSQICTGDMTRDKHVNIVDRGDSGSALVMEKDVQLGVACFIKENIHLAVYVNVTFFYKWIVKNSKYASGNQKLI